MPLPVHLCIASETSEKQGHSHLCRATHRRTSPLSRSTIKNLDCVFVTNTHFFCCQGPPCLPPGYGCYCKGVIINLLLLVSWFLHTFTWPCLHCKTKPIHFCKWVCCLFCAIEPPLDRLLSLQFYSVRRLFISWAVVAFPRKNKILFLVFPSLNSEYCVV